MFKQLVVRSIANPLSQHGLAGMLGSSLLFDLTLWCICKPGFFLVSAHGEVILGSPMSRLFQCEIRLRKHVYSCEILEMTR